MKLLFEFDPKKCSACGACAVACMDQNDINAEEKQRPYRKVYSYEMDGEFASVSIACLHCPDAPCVDACPAGCLYKDPETGLTAFDTTNCIGCHSCAMACPFGAPSFRKKAADPRRETMEKCHGCIERVRNGKKPACVHTCPTGALSVHWTEDDSATSSLAQLYASWNGITKN